MRIETSENGFWLTLANLALEFSFIPGTAVPSARVWSDGGNIISSGRQSISPANFRMLIFLQENRNIEFLTFSELIDFHRLFNQ